MSDVTVNNLQADSINTTDLTAGNILVNGTARFTQPIFANIDGAKDINTVNIGAISADSYVMFSGTNGLFRVKYSDLIADLATKVSVEFADSEGVGY